MRTIDINLLPPEYAPPKLRSLRTIVLMLLSAVIIFLLLGASGKLLITKNNYIQQKEQLSREEEYYVQQLKQIYTLQRQAKMIKASMKPLSDIINQRVIWSDKLMELYRCKPENLWFTEISLEFPGNNVNAKIPKSKNTNATNKKMSIHISGDTLSISQIGTFISNLEKSPFFEATKFISASQKELQKSPADDSPTQFLITFNITTQLKTRRFMATSK